MKGFLLLLHTVGGGINNMCLINTGSVIGTDMGIGIGSVAFCAHGGRAVFYPVKRTPTGTVTNGIDLHCLT